jgi:3-phosphoshikimate 1-carboxyvinyltransferase
MATGRSRVRGYLDAADTRSTLAAVGAVGAGVEQRRAGDGSLEVEIEGVGLRGARSAEIDVGNAGTLLRIMPGWLAGQPQGRWTLDGDESIRRRPVDRVAEPLREMGARVECREGRLPPLRVEATQLLGIDYVLPIASAQVTSCLLLAGLLADAETSVTEPSPTRDHTERMLADAGARIHREPVAAARGPAGRLIAISPAERLDPLDLHVPGDFSSAAFHLVAALVVPGSDVRLEGVGVNPSRTGLLQIARRMGADLSVTDRRKVTGEPEATIVARHAPLSGTAVSADEVPLAIDELPLVALLGCFATGETVVSGAEELRHKESDRIGGVVEGLRALGSEIEGRPDGFAVRGERGLRGGLLNSRGDHRLAMLGAVAGLGSRKGVEVVGFDSAAVSYPGFEADLRTLAGG